MIRKCYIRKAAAVTAFVRPALASAVFTSMVIALASPAVAGSVAAERWQSLATTILRPVAQDDQLPNGATPMAIAADGQGFVWVGTQNGLARWDGQRFHIFNAGYAGGSLPDSQVAALHQDARGHLWIGTL